MQKIKWIKPQKHVRLFRHPGLATWCLKLKIWWCRCRRLNCEGGREGGELHLTNEVGKIENGIGSIHHGASKNRLPHSLSQQKPKTSNQRPKTSSKMALLSKTAKFWKSRNPINKFYTIKYVYLSATKPLFLKLKATLPNVKLAAFWVDCSERWTITGNDENVDQFGGHQQNRVLWSCKCFTQWRNSLPTLCCSHQELTVQPFPLWMGHVKS